MSAIRGNMTLLVLFATHLDNELRLFRPGVGHHQHGSNPPKLCRRRPKCGRNLPALFVQTWPTLVRSTQISSKPPQSLPRLNPGWLDPRFGRCEPSLAQSSPDLVQSSQHWPFQFPNLAEPSQIRSNRAQIEQAQIQPNRTHTRSNTTHVGSKQHRIWPNPAEVVRAQTS